MTLARTRRGSAVSLLALAACAGPADDPMHRVRGPLPTRIQQPVAQIFPSPRPRRATLLEPDAGRATIDVEYSSIFERSVEFAEEANFDGEMARLGTRLSYGIGPGMELLIEPAILFASSGFLDSFVDEFHRASGFASGGRTTFEQDEYSMRLRRGADVAWEFEEDRIMFADLPITYLAQVRDEDSDGPAIAARVTLELPTGDESRGAGSGGWDTAAGVLIERSLGRWTFTSGIDGVYVDQPESFIDAGIHIRTLLFLSGGIEYRWSDRLSLLGQVVFRSALTRDLEAEEINREIVDLGFGFAYDITRSTSFYASFHEDAVAASGSDLTLYFGLAYGF